MHSVPDYGSVRYRWQSRRWSANRPSVPSPIEVSMPTYVYECAKCGEEMEEWQSFAD